MTRLSREVGTVLVLVCAVACDAPEEAPQSAVLQDVVDAGGVVATVDGRPITRSRLERAVAAEGSGADPAVVLDKLVTLEVLAVEAERRGLANDEDVRDEARRVAVQRFLADEFEAHTRPADVPDAVLLRAYTANHAFYNNPDVLLVTHLLVPVEEDAPEARWANARALAARARVRIMALAPTDRTRKAASAIVAELQPQWDAELTAQSLQWISRESPLVQEFKDAAFALGSDDDVSPPVRTRFGFHIIVRDEFKEERETPFETVREEVRGRAWPGWRRTELVAFVDRLSAAAGVEVRPEPLRRLPKD